MESYNLITRGELVTGTNVQQAEDYLKKIKVSPAAIKHILYDRKPCVIKRELPLKQAEKVRNLFFQGGLLVDIDLSLGPECFALGVMPCKQKQEKVSAPSREQACYTFEEEVLQPSLYGHAKVSDIACKKEKQKIKLERVGHQWNPVLLFAGCAIATVYLEIYLVRLLSQYFGLGIMATVFGILFLVAGIVLLPGLIQPLNVFKLTQGDRAIVLIERYFWHPQKRQYTVWDENGDPLGSIDCDRENAEFYNDQGDLVFKWDKLLSVKDVGDEKIEAVHEGAVSDIQSDIISNYWGYIQFARRIFIRTTNDEKEDWSYGAGVPLIDQERRFLGALFQRDHLGVRLRGDSQDTLLILGFSTAVLRASL